MRLDSLKYDRNLNKILQNLQLLAANRTKLKSVNDFFVPIVLFLRILRIRAQIKMLTLLSAFETLIIIFIIIFILIKSRLGYTLA